jgi:sensor histidine kinase regulating citrate/malate metabolism
MSTVNPSALVATLWSQGIDLTADAAAQLLEERTATMQAIAEVIDAMVESRERERALVGAAVERLMQAVEKQQADADKRYRNLVASMKAPTRLNVIRDDNGRAVAYDQVPLVADGSMTVQEYHRQIDKMLADLDIGNGNGNGGAE